MDDLGLPSTFGKPEGPTDPLSKSAKNTSSLTTSRGGSQVRGPRGVVGGGKRGRGRGRGQTEITSGEGREELNGSIKVIIQAQVQKITETHGVATVPTFKLRPRRYTIIPIRTTQTLHATYSE